MYQELQIFAAVYMYSGAGCLVRLCDSDFGITPIDDITIGITCAAFCFHIAHISLLLLLLLTAIELSLGGSSPYTSTDKTNKNKYT